MQNTTGLVVATLVSSRVSGRKHSGSLGSGVRNRAVGVGLGVFVRVGIGLGVLVWEGLATIGGVEVRVKVDVGLGLVEEGLMSGEPVNFR
jgi:hypothetical protein